MCAGTQSCTAGRAAFLTGQHGIRTGLTKVGFPGAPMGMSQLDPSIGGLLKNLGRKEFFLPPWGLGRGIPPDAQRGRAVKPSVTWRKSSAKAYRRFSELKLRSLPDVLDSNNQLISWTHFRGGS
jgi:arylsulfatase A-like enzyme